VHIARVKAQPINFVAIQKLLVVDLPRELVLATLIVCVVHAEELAKLDGNRQNATRGSSIEALPCKKVLIIAFNT